MKTKLKFFILIAIVASVFACQMGNAPGSITLDIPQRYLSARSLDASRSVDASTPTHVRIWLEVRGQIQALSDTQDYYQAEIPTSNSVTLEGLSPAKNCVLYISLGTLENDIFVPIRFASSPSAFQVLAGSTSYVLLTVKESPFDRIASVSDPDGVKVLYYDSKYYSLANDKLVLPSGTELAVSGAQSLTLGKVMNANGTFGAARIWVNTSTGIIPFNPASGTLETVITETKDRKIFDSGIVSVPYDNVTYQVAYYQRLGSLGFARLQDGKWQWKDLMDVLAEKGGMESLSNLIKGSTAGLLGDMDVHYDSAGAVSYGFVIVPVLNTFRFDKSLGSLFGGVIPDPITMTWITEKFINQDTLVEVPAVGEVKPLIKTISQSGTYLHIGTDQGVFIGSTDANGKMTTKPALVVGLPRKAAIVKIRSTTVATSVWAAALGSDGTLFLFKDGAYVKEYRFHSGVPEVSASSTSDLFWNDKGLVITGTNGVVLLPVAKLTE